jgi:predicted kinase
MVGCPGSGKTTIAKHICNTNNYINIEGDIYKTSTKMIKASLMYIIEKKSIIYDATNSSTKKRKEYIDIGKKYNYNIICIHLNTSISISKKRNKLRDEKYIVPNIAYSIYLKNYNEPLESEGFTLYII